MSDRKARLAALAAKANRSKKVDEETTNLNEETDEHKASKALTLRNYTPSDLNLAANNNDCSNDEPIGKRHKKEETSVLQQALEQAQAETSVQQSVSDDIVAGAPRKINWDLKRDIDPKLEKLARRTQKAIVELLKARLEEQANELD
jgi:coiled-coil domain-containing protein 12